jgi:hypothetical protein
MITHGTLRLGDLTVEFKPAEKPDMLTVQAIEFGREWRYREAVVSRRDLLTTLAIALSEDQEGEETNEEPWDAAECVAKALDGIRIEG